MQIRFTQIFSFSIILLTIISLNPWSVAPVGNTYTNWTFYSFLLALFYIGKVYYYNPYQKKNLIFAIYILWAIIGIVRGLFVAELYWDWKNLTNASFILLLPICTYMFTHPGIVKKTMSTWLKWGLPLYFVMYFFITFSTAAFYLTPLLLFVLFFPKLNNKWKLYLLFFLIIIFLGYTNRSALIKYGAALAFSFVFYFRKYFPPLILKTIHANFMLLPFLFFALAATNVFNIFDLEEYIEEKTVEITTQSGDIKKESLTVDTRTFLYEDVILSAINNNYVYFGRTPAKGNDTEIGTHFAEDLGTGRYERFSNEVAILNIFTWLGLTGVILHFLVFLQSSYLAIYRSNNLYIKIVGLYVAFRWIIAWVEDVNRFNIINLCLWMMIGMCLSNSFRKMSNKEFYNWLKSIFNFKTQLV